MTCSHRERAVTAEICAVPGVESVSVDVPSSIVTVTASEPVDRADIAAAVDEAGYVLAPERPHAAARSPAATANNTEHHSPTQHHPPTHPPPASRSHPRRDPPP